MVIIYWAPSKKVDHVPDIYVQDTVSFIGSRSHDISPVS